jgi:hypothetical protein
LHFCLDEQPPTACPKQPKANIGNDGISIMVSWDDPGTKALLVDDGMSVDLEVAEVLPSTGASGSEELKVFQCEELKVFQWLADGLKLSRGYQVRIRLRNKYGQGRWSKPTVLRTNDNGRWWLSSSSG